MLSLPFAGSNCGELFILDPPSGGKVNFSTMTDDFELIQQLRTGSVKAFKKLCYYYSEDMILFAYGLLGDREMADKVTCDVLLRLWSLDGFQVAEPPLGAFLFRAVREAASKFRINPVAVNGDEKLGIYT